MLSPPARLVLHLDADAFFASVEQRDDPRLRGKPVAVGTGVVASCSYESRRYGVATGMRLSEARRLCRELIVLPGEYPRYEQAARRMLAICQERTPLVEVAALDDLYLDVTRHRRPDAVPAELREQVQDEVKLSVSIGVASSKLVAQVATRAAKPGRQVAVPPGTERGYLAPWPARVLHGVGRQALHALDRLNVQRVGQVADMPVPLLAGLFGKQGRSIHEQAHGIDHRPVRPHRPPQSVSRCSSFDPPTGDRAFLRAMLDYLMDRAAAWLRFHDRAARGLGVTIRYGDHESAVGREAFRRPVHKETELKEAARDRFERLYQRRLPLRLVGIELSPVVAPDPQPTLFADPQEERAGRLTACLDAVRQRFGFTSVMSGAGLLLTDRMERDRENLRMRTPCLSR